MDDQKIAFTESRFATLFNVVASYMAPLPPGGFDLSPRRRVRATAASGAIANPGAIGLSASAALADTFNPSDALWIDGALVSFINNLGGDVQIVNMDFCLSAAAAVYPANVLTRIGSSYSPLNRVFQDGDCTININPVTPFWSQRDIVSMGILRGSSLTQPWNFVLFVDVINGPSFPILNQVVNMELEVWYRKISTIAEG